MRWIRKCPVFFLLTVSGLFFTLVGIAGRFSLYGGYEFRAAREPFLALVMEGIDNGIAPWDLYGGWKPLGSEVQAAAAVTGEGGQSIENLPEEEFATAGESTAAPGLPEGESAEAETAESTAAPGQPEGISVAGTAEETETAVTYGFREVTEDYFDDAAFIGDSRTVGLFEYGGLEERADFFAKISLTIYDVFTEPVAKDEETGDKITVEEALRKKQYGKVYLMLGINELGTGNTEYFMNHYAAAVEKIRELQPDAIIFVEAIMRVTGEKDANDPIFNNANINEKNEAISLLADNRDVFYIDVNEAVGDGEGNLNSEYTIDEIHLKAKYYSVWKEFLLKHGIVRE